MNRVKVWLPSFVGRMASDAQQALKGDPYRMRVRTQTQPSIRPRGEVVEQRPRDTEVSPETVVTLYLSDGSLVSVPNLQGLEESSARTQLATRGLRPRVEGQTSTSPAGTVMDQSPQAGQVVRRDSEVAIGVAVAPAQVWVSTVVGQNQETARRTLQGDQSATGRQPAAPRLVVRSLMRRSSAPRDEVVGQDPMQGYVPFGSTVTIIVSDGSLVHVPGVVNLPEPDARNALANNGLRAEVGQHASHALVDTVIDQQPQAGSEVERGSTVRITVAVAVAPTQAMSGPALVRVPSVIGQQESAARVALQAAWRRPGAVSPGIRTETRPSSAPRDEVIGQAPVETSVPFDSTVTLIVSDGSLVRVPSVQSLDETAAQTLLRETGLGARIERQSSQLRERTVIGQDPPAGSEVARTSVVALTVAAPQVTAPLFPWLWAVGALPAGAAALGWARYAKARALARKPVVDARFAGPASRPQAASLEGPPLRIEIEASRPYSGDRPNAQISQEKLHE